MNSLDCPFLTRPLRWNLENKRSVVRDVRPSDEMEEWTAFGPTESQSLQGSIRTHSSCSVPTLCKMSLAAVKEMFTHPYLGSSILLLL